MLNDQPLFYANEHTPPDNDASSAQLTDTQLLRLAELIATGEESIPMDLTAEQAALVFAAVNLKRRKRLIRLFAGAIANDIHKPNLRTERNP